MSSIMKRLPQIILITTFLPFCWLSMQAAHEFGHVLAAWATGGQVTHVALYPTVFSRTDLAYNPRPLVVVCAGPLIGALLPLVAFLLAAMGGIPGVFLFRFFAGFCLIANGAYMAFGPGEGGADTGIMLSHGLPRVVLVLFGMLAIPTGLYLWHRQGAHFGLGNAQDRVQWSTAIASAALLLTMIGLEILFNCR
jgi:hypothetical protein